MTYKATACKLEWISEHEGFEMDIYALLDELKKMENNPGSSSDVELDHVRADEILCEIISHYGHHDIVDAYSKILKWYA